jgi:4,5-DOPA dioxygenase extradiol
MNQTKQPVVFFGHGSPMNAIQETDMSRKWKELGAEFRLNLPKAVLVVSAHWLTEGTKITENHHPRTIHDFGGFPEELYKIEYPAPGNPKLAKEICSWVQFTSITCDQEWGLDHGTWSILRWVFPEANVPVVQLSIDRRQDFSWYYALGNALSNLREQGILLVGSGNLVHNLALLNWQNWNEKPEWAVEANETLKSLIRSRNIQELEKGHSISESVSTAINSAEHFVPALFCLGFGSQATNLEFFNDIVQSSISMTSFILK